MSRCSGRLKAPGTHLRAEAGHAVGPRATLCQALGQQPGGQAVVGRGQRAVVLQQVARAAALAVVQAEEGSEGGGGGGGRAGVSTRTSRSRGVER